MIVVGWSGGHQAVVHDMFIKHNESVSSAQRLRRRGTVPVRKHEYSTGQLFSS